MKTSKSANSFLGTTDNTSTGPSILIEESTQPPASAMRSRRDSAPACRKRSRRVSIIVPGSELGSLDNSYVFLAENEIEAKKITNNMIVSEVNDFFTFLRLPVNK